MEFEDNYFEDIARYFKANQIVRYCLPYSYSLNPPNEGTYEWMVWVGMAHFAGIHQSMKENIPFHFVYSLDEYKYWANARYPINLSAWKNISNTFQPTVWIFILISLTLLSLSFLTTFKVYKLEMPNENLTTKSNVDILEFFILTFASIMEPDPISWFNKSAFTGRLLTAVWMFSCLMLNLAFISNLRATLLRPATEKPIDKLQDAFDRKSHIWVGHLVPDPSQPDFIHQYFLEERLNPAVREHIYANGMSTYPLLGDSLMPDYVKEDIELNGASIIFPVNCI